MPVGGGGWTLDAAAKESAMNRPRNPLTVPECWLIVVLLLSTVVAGVALVRTAGQQGFTPVAEADG